MLILGLLLLLAVLRCAYLETVVRRLDAEKRLVLARARRERANERLAVEVATAQAAGLVAEAMAANLRPVGNVDLVPSNVVPIGGREEPSS